MLRVHCSCGKSLKVDDKLAGKKIKCPACGTVQLVKAADGDELQAAPKAPVPNGESGKGAPKKAKGSAAEVLPRRTKPPAKVARPVPWLLIGAGGGGLLLIFVVGMGCWLLFLRPSEKPQPVAVTPAATKDADERKDEVVVKPEPVAIKLFVPHKKGDRREITLTREEKTTTEVTNLDQFPPEVQAKLAGFGTFDVKASCQGIVRTLEVNGSGEETKVQITLDQLESVKSQKADVARLSLPKGTVVLGSLSGTQFSWTSSNAELTAGMDQELTGLLSNSYGDVMESNADNALGTNRPQLAGGTWPVNSQAVAQEITNQIKIQNGGGNGLVAGKVNGTGKLVKMFQIQGAKCLDVSFAFDIALKGDVGSGSGHSDITVFLSGDAMTGPVKKTGKIKVDMDVETPSANGDSSVVQPKLKIKARQSFTVEIKYLDNTPIEDGPTPTVIPKANVPLALRLKNVKAAWVDGKTAVDLSADYSIAGETKPKPDADYILYVKFADGDGGKKSYAVQTLSGSALSAQKNFANSSLAVGIPPKNKGSYCDIVLVEKAPGNPQETVIDSQDNVFVSGTPPAPPVVAVNVQLSNGKVERLPKSMARFTVDYKFTTGQADGQKTYRLMANMSAGKKALVPAKPFEGKGSQLDTQGTLTYEIPYDVATATKFEFYLTEAEGKNSKAKEVSNRLAGNMTADPAVANVQFLISQPLANKMGGGGKKAAPAQAFQLQFQWKLVAGQLNPQATYSFVVLMAGNTVLLPNAPQVTAQGVYSQQLPYSGPTAFSLYIVESIPDQQPRTVSNTQNVRVK